MGAQCELQLPRGAAQVVVDMDGRPLTAAELEARMVGRLQNQIMQNAILGAPLLEHIVDKGASVRLGQSLAKWGRSWRVRRKTETNQAPSSRMAAGGRGRS